MKFTEDDKETVAYACRHVIIPILYILFIGAHILNFIGIREPLRGMNAWADAGK